MIRLWDADTGELRTTLSGHQGTVRALDFSPDGSQLASGGSDGRAILWDHISARQIASVDLAHRICTVSAVAFAPDGDSLVVGGGAILGSGIVDYFPFPVAVWRLNGQRELSSVGYHTLPLRDVAFSPSGESFASMDSQGFVKIWNSSDEKLRHQFQTGCGGAAGRDGGHALAISPDGATAAIVGRGFELWNVEQETLIRRYLGHEGYAGVVRFDATGRALVSGGDDGTVRVWDTLSDQNLSTRQLGHAIRSIGMSPDGRHMVALGGPDKTLQPQRAVRLPEPTSLPRHTRAPAACIAVSPDQSIVAVADRSGRLELWDLDSRRLLGERSLDTVAASIAISPDGTKLAVACLDDTVWVGSVAAGPFTKCHQHPSRLISVAFLNESQRLVVAGRKGIVIWDIDNGEKDNIDLESNLTCAVVSPNGKHLVANLEVGAIQILELQNPHSGWTWFPQAHHSWVHALAFSPDGSRLASDGRAGRINLWDFDTGTLERTIVTHHGAALCLAFSQDGETLACGSESTAGISIWDVQSGQQRAELFGSQGEVKALAFVQDGTILVSCANDGAVRFWDADVPKPLQMLLGHGGDVTSVAFSPDGRTLASAGRDQTIRLWDVQTRRQTESPLPQQPSRYQVVAFSPDGNWLATTNGSTVRLLDRKSREEALLRVDPAEVKSLVFSPDSKTFVAGFRGQGHVWNVASRRVVRTLKGPPHQMFDPAFSPDGQQLASAGWARAQSTLRLWDTETWDFEGFNTFDTSIQDLAYAPSGPLLALTCADYSIRIWDLAKRREIESLKGHEGVVVCVAFSPDGQVLASASHDRTVRLWDVESLQPLETLFGHTHWVTWVAFSPDGKLLASASSDRTIKLWPIDSKRWRVEKRESKRRQSSERVDDANPSR